MQLTWRIEDNFCWRLLDSQNHYSLQPRLCGKMSFWVFQSGENIASNSTVDDQVKFYLAFMTDPS